MAMFNEILVGRFNRALTRIFSLGAQSGSPQIAGDVQGALDLLSALPEMAHLREERLMCGRLLVNAAAGNESGIKIINPAGSGVLCVLEQMILCTDVAARTLWGPTANLGTGNQGGGFQVRDNRIGTIGTALTPILLVGENSVPGGFAFTVSGSVVQVATRSTIVSIGQVVGPGSAFVTQKLAPNETNDATFLIRVIPAPPEVLA